MDTAPQKLFYRVATVALMLDISRSGAYQLINQGDLPAVKIGKSIRVPAEALADFANKAKEAAHLS